MMATKSGVFQRMDAKKPIVAMFQITTTMLAAMIPQRVNIFHRSVCMDGE
jgi:hypothetical protein